MDRALIDHGRAQARMADQAAARHRWVRADHHARLAIEELGRGLGASSRELVAPLLALARASIGRGDLAAGDAALTRALSLRAPSPIVAADAQRVRAVLAWRRGDAAAARAIASAALDQLHRGGHADTAVAVELTTWLATHDDGAIAGRRRRRID